MKIANPIYDIVFKYLMEDERVARTILSALLKVDVLAVEVRPHEYSDEGRDTLSVFRIDFGATIRDEEGKEKLILIELQKTWLETETLRFRQYLGVHYSNPKNMQDAGSALPMVAVYLLGHKVGDIEEPVLYVNHQSLDYDNRVVTKGLPDPFVDSLTHDSIIVQIPRLHGKINNRLDMVLSIFDQTRRDENDNRILQLDDSVYGDDADMERILHRLTKAAADADMRHRMNVEDEYFSVIEKRDTEILMRDKQLAEQKATIKEMDGTIKEMDGTIKEMDGTIKEMDGTIKEKDAMLRSTISMLLDSGMTPSQIADRLSVSVDVVKSLI